MFMNFYLGKNGWHQFRGSISSSTLYYTNVKLISGMILMSSRCIAKTFFLEQVTQKPICGRYDAFFNIPSMTPSLPVTAVAIMMTTVHKISHLMRRQCPARKSSWMRRILSLNFTFPRVVNPPITTSPSDTSCGL